MGMVPSEDTTQAYTRSSTSTHSVILEFEEKPHHQNKIFETKILIQNYIPKELGKVRHGLSAKLPNSYVPVESASFLSKCWFI